MNRTALLAAFAGFPVRLAAAADAASSAPVAPGDWGTAEVVRHLMAVERAVWHVRLAQVATEDDPRWDWTEPGLAPGFDDASLARILASFADVRAESVVMVVALDEAGWARAGIHATYGRLDVAGLLKVAVDHDQEHLRGIAPGG